MARALLYAIMSAALVSVPATTRAQKVNVDFDGKADFAKYRTYTWAKGTPAPSPLTEQRIHDAIDRELAKKGLTKTETSPGLVVVSHLTTDEELNINTFGYGYGSGWGYGHYGGMGGSSTTTVNKYIVGTVVVDLYDVQTKNLVCRGIATDTASDKPEKNAKKISKGSAEKMFKKYPPKKTT